MSAAARRWASYPTTPTFAGDPVTLTELVYNWVLRRLDAL